jgi:hypothetical protein
MRAATDSAIRAVSVVSDQRASPARRELRVDCFQANWATAADLAIFCPGAGAVGRRLVSLSADATLTGVRYYALPGGGTAFRTGTGTNYGFKIGDGHGTSALMLDYTGQNPTWRQFTPFGQTRGTAHRSSLADMRPVTLRRDHSPLRCRGTTAGPRGGSRTARPRLLPVAQDAEY